MATLTLELTLDQLIQAIDRLSAADRLRVAGAILKDYRSDINKRFGESLTSVHAAYPNLNEDKVMEEINQLVHEIRSEHHDQNSR